MSEVEMLGKIEELNELLFRMVFEQDLAKFDILDIRRTENRLIILKEDYKRVYGKLPKNIFWMA